jgi:hypothetical protein
MLWWQDHEQEIFKAYERKSNANLLVYPAQSMGVRYAAIDRSSARSVFYVTVGQMKHWKVTIKPLDQGDKVIVSFFRNVKTCLNLDFLFAESSK